MVVALAHCSRCHAETAAWVLRSVCIEARLASFLSCMHIPAPPSYHYPWLTGPVCAAACLCPLRTTFTEANRPCMCLPLTGPRD